MRIQQGFNPGRHVIDLALRLVRSILLIGTARHQQLTMAFTGFRNFSDEKMLSYDKKNQDWKWERVGIDTYQCNVFDLTNDYNEYGIISDIMIYTCSIGSAFSLYIAPANVDGSPPDISSLTDPVAMGVESYEGYVTVKLVLGYKQFPKAYETIVKCSKI
jgi:hypothetical protein